MVVIATAAISTMLALAANGEGPRPSLAEALGDAEATLASGDYDATVRMALGRLPFPPRVELDGLAAKSVSVPWYLSGTKYVIEVEISFADPHGGETHSPHGDEIRFDIRFARESSVKGRLFFTRRHEHSSEEEWREHVEEQISSRIKSLLEEGELP